MDAIRTDDGDRAHHPLVPAHESPRELTARAIVIGVVGGTVFGVANAYVGLQTGFIVSGSIPLALMMAAATRIPRRDPSGVLLETTLAQATGSAASSVASAMILTLPALWLLDARPDAAQLVALGAGGGLLGVLFTALLRRCFIVREHGRLPYPEGAACAAALAATQDGGGRAGLVVAGAAAGAAIQAIVGGLKLLHAKVAVALPLVPNAIVSVHVSAALFGAGYVLGPRVAAVLAAGGLLAALVIVPAFAAPAEDGTSVAAASVDLWIEVARYVGAGAVAAAGAIAFVESAPAMLASLRKRAGAYRVRFEIGGLGTRIEDMTKRTERELSIGFVGFLVALVSLFLTFGPFALDGVPAVSTRAGSVLLALGLAAVLTAVSARVAGLIGATANATSGAAIVTLLAASAVLLVSGGSGAGDKVAALVVGAVAAIAASVAGNAAQDLKAGFLVGATPRRQQIGELLGVSISAMVAALAVTTFTKAPGFGASDLPAPQATLTKLAVDGLFDGSLPWHLVGIGAAIAVVARLLRVPALTFSIGLFLPLSTTMTLLAGGLVRSLARRRAADGAEQAARTERGVLLGAGMIGGEGLAGALVVGGALLWPGSRDGVGGSLSGPFGNVAAFGLLVLTAAWFHRSVLGRGRS